MEKPVVVLSPFEELTRAVSTATSITVLKCRLFREDGTNVGIKTVKSTLFEAVAERFNHVETELIYSIAIVHWWTPDAKKGKSHLIQYFICIYAYCLGLIKSLIK